MSSSPKCSAFSTRANGFRPRSTSRSTWPGRFIRYRPTAMWSTRWSSPGCTTTTWENQTNRRAMRRQICGSRNKGHGRMLSKEENELLTRVGPGTPCGELMRRYWHPIYPEALLRENPVRKVRILCEDLTLFRDRSGKLGLIQERCAHRCVSLHLGIPDERGLRC